MYPTMADMSVDLVGGTRDLVSVFLLRNTFILSGLPSTSSVSVMTNLPVAPVERMIKEAGAERVSGTAAKALAGVLEDHGTEIATKAIKLAKHAGRKTVTAQDIKLAVR